VRQLDRVISFLLENLQYAEAASTALSTVRALGCVLYANAERASKWYDGVTTALSPYATGSSRFKAGPDGVCLSQVQYLRAGRRRDGVRLAFSVLLFTHLRPTSLMQAALVSFGNLAAKAGPRWHSQHGVMLPLVITVVAGARSPPLRFVSGSDDATARLLSSALRLLLFLIQAAAPAVLEQVGVSHLMGF
jgi:hypothetical protein